MSNGGLIEEEVDELLVDRGITFETGFLRALPLLTVQERASATYHVQRWRSAYRLGQGLFDHEFVHFNDAEETDAGSVVALWRSGWIARSASLRSFVLNVAPRLSGKLIVVSDSFSGVRLSPTSIRSLDHVHVPMNYEVRYRRFMGRMMLIRDVSGWNWTSNAILPCLGLVDVLGGGSAQSSELVSDPASLIPNVVLRRMTRASNEYYAAQLLTRPEIAKYLAPWLEPSPQRDRLIESIDLFRERHFDPDDMSFASRLSLGLEALAQCNSPCSRDIAEVVTRCAV